MCGIVGLVSIGHDDCEPRLHSMVNSVAHRGPDGQGVLVRKFGDWTVALGHTRLAILDLSSAGAQPMASQTRPVWISFNGEIYNFRELRQELESQNCSFRSQSDTEVILRIYETWGPEGFRRLRGMFAFALWDEQAKHLLLVRDPLGIKPLYVYQSNQRLVFASEVRAVLASGLPSRRFSPAGLSSYLRWGSVQAPHTIIEGIRSLMPGECLKVSLREKTLEESSAHLMPLLDAPLLPPAPRTRDEAVAHLRELLLDSVRAHVVSDVPVGVFLSSGVDSRSILALLSRLQNQRPLTFTVDFAEGQFSEGAVARKLADHFHTEHHEVRLSESDVIGILPRALKAMDQPSIDGINTYVISNAVHSLGVKVTLSGLGGDELFAGYPSFQRAMDIRKLTPLPRSMRQAAAAIGRIIADHSPQRQKFWALFSSDLSPNAAYDISRSLFTAQEVTALMPDAREPAFPSAWSHLNGRNALRDPINAVSIREIKGYMANTLLRDSDTMGMAHGLEIRVPFVDSVLAPYVLSLPGKWKVEPGRAKPLLQEAVGETFPDDIPGRPKMGFTLPFARWLSSSLESAMTECLLEDTALLRQAGLSSAAVANTWRLFTHSKTGEGWSRPWSLYVLAQWCQQNRVTW